MDHWKPAAHSSVNSQTTAGVNWPVGKCRSRIPPIARLGLVVPKRSFSLQLIHRLAFCEARQQREILHRVALNFQPDAGDGPFDSETLAGINQRCAAAIEMKPRIAAGAHDKPVYETADTPHPALERELRDSRGRLGDRGWT